MTFGSLTIATEWLKNNGWPKASIAAISRVCRQVQATAYGKRWQFAEKN
jgi:hypothetical protein